jgi:hypothetical protein
MMDLENSSRVKSRTRSGPETIIAIVLDVPVHWLRRKSGARMRKEQEPR